MTAADLFEKAASQASFHYADDSTKEWGAARKCKGECLRLYVENPELRDRFREFMKSQLWGVEFENDIVLPTWVSELEKGGREAVLLDALARMSCCKVEEGDWPSREIGIIRCIADIEGTRAEYEATIEKWADRSRRRRKNARRAQA